VHVPADEYADGHAKANADRHIDEHPNGHADGASEQYDTDGDANSVIQPDTPPADRPTLPTRLVEAVTPLTPSRRPLASRDVACGRGRR
jgi:hypothetical protein